MKNLIRIAVLTVIAFSAITVYAQKKEKQFSGTITYLIESVGEVPIPIRNNESAVKIMGERVSYNNILVNGQTIHKILDFSQAQLMAGQLGIGTDYTGTWKAYITQTISQETIDSLFMEGNYKIDYLEETKNIAGLTAKKAKVTIQTDDGNTIENDVWHVENIGPEYDFIFVPGLKGFPLEYTSSLGNGSAVKLTAKEINQKKLKETEFLLPAGFDKITDEQFKELMEILEELMEKINQ